MRPHPSRLDLLDAQTDETERENGLPEAATAQRQAAGSWKQARGGTDPEASAQALRDQISDAVNCDRCARNPSGQSRSKCAVILGRCRKVVFSDPIRGAWSREVQCTHSFGRLREIQFTAPGIQKILRVACATTQPSQNRGIFPMSLKYGSDQKAGGGGRAAREREATPD
jgi:hypothetical protein